MRENMTSGDVIERLVQQAGIRKKLAAEVLHAIPEIIEEALKTEGEVRVKGLGTFRMKWTQPRVGRNPKTGERVDIPAHNRLVFLPEQSFKEFVNRDNRLLSYKVIPVPEFVPPPVSIDEPLPPAEYEAPAETGALAEPIPEPQPPARKRRIHWIIPAAIAVILVLCVVFYFRNFSTVGGRRSAVGGQKKEMVEQKSSSDTLPSKIENRPSTMDNRPSTIDNDKMADSTQNSELLTPNATLNTQNSKLALASEGRHLFRLAREVYGNPFLWVLIYRANPDKIPDPDMLITGKEIIIPELEGKPDHLSRNDSAAVSDGYRLVYEFYKAKGDSRAEDFRRGADKYKPR